MAHYSMLMFRTFKPPNKLNRAKQNVPILQYVVDSEMGTWIRKGEPA